MMECAPPLSALAPVRRIPFAHAVVDDFLAPEIYACLARSFPRCAAGSGPTGFTCFRGDAAYDLLLEQPAWQALHTLFHSQEFVDYMLGQFADIFREQCVHDLSAARYVDYVEDRIDKESPRLRRVLHAPDRLWVRMDVMQGWVGYDRQPHLDHRRRAATLLLYFSDADAIGMKGGDLHLHDRTGTVAAAVRARGNRAALFPCCNASLHSVSPITETRLPRNFVQVTVSSSVDLWSPVNAATPLWRRAAGKASSFLR